MALEIFRLVGSVFVDTDAAEESLKKTDKNAENLGERFVKGVGTAASWGAAIVGAAAAATTAMVGVATSSAGAMDEIDKGSAKIGISKQAYQEWNYVLGQNGMDISKLETGMKTLVAAMDSAASGTASAQENFDKLGISIYDASGQLKDQETILNEAMYALANMENGTEKARLATELFGKAGVDMMPMLNAGAEGMSELTDRAHDLGLIMSDEAVNAGVVLGDTMDDVNQSFEALGNQLGVSFMPMIQTVLDLILANLPMIQDMFAQLSPILTSLLEQLVPPLLQLAEQLLPVVFSLLETLLPVFSQIVDAVLPVIVQLLDMLLPPLVEVIEQLLPPLLELLLPILDLLQPVLDLLQPILDIVVAVLEPLAELISTYLTPLIDLISQLIEWALVPLQDAFNILAEILEGTLNAALEQIMNVVEMVTGVFTGLIDFITGIFTGDWDKAWAGISKIFGSIWEGIKNLFKTPINWIIDGINVFIRGINKVKIPDWVPGVGGMGFNIAELPKLAQGGVLERGQVGLLEGSGAEAVVPLHQNRQWVSAVAKDMDAAVGGSSGSSVVALLRDILSALDELKNMAVFLDTGELVGGLIKPLDAKMGQIQAMKARG